MTEKKKPGPETVVREIKRITRRKFSSEEKIRIVLEGLQGEGVSPPWNTRRSLPGSWLFLSPIITIDSY